LPGDDSAFLANLSGSVRWERKPATAARQQVIAMATAKATGRPVNLAG